MSMSKLQQTSSLLTKASTNSELSIVERLTEETLLLSTGGSPKCSSQAQLSEAGSQGCSLAGYEARFQAGSQVPAGSPGD